MGGFGYPVRSVQFTNVSSFPDSRTEMDLGMRIPVLHICYVMLWLTEVFFVSLGPRHTQSKEEILLNIDRTFR